MADAAAPGLTRVARWHRLTGAALAGLVQVFIAASLVFWAVQTTPQRRAAREVVFRLLPQRIVAPLTVTIDARAPSSARTLRQRPAPALQPPAPAVPTPGLAGFGQILFGCAPENYAALSADARAHCPKPGEELALNREPDLMHTPSHTKHMARWANALAHRQSPLFLPGGYLFPLAALSAVLDGSVTERSSAFRDPEQWPSYVDPQDVTPHSLDEQEKIDQAWHKDHPTP